RRRHTRSTRDWSSDVCSSDLAAILNIQVVVPPGSVTEAFETIVDSFLARAIESRRESQSLTTLRDTLLPKLMCGALRIDDPERRSEERRVGKECRSRRRPTD